MNKKISKHKKIRSILLILTFLTLQVFYVSNSFAIKLSLNGLPLASNSTVLTLTESVVYNYASPFRPLVTNTDNPYLCIGPNLNGTPSANVSFGLSSSDPFRIYGLVDIASATYDYSPLLLADKVVNIQTGQNSQCVVKGYAKVSNPSPGNPFIFLDSFETGGSISTAAFPDVSVSLLEETVNTTLVNNKVLSNANNFTYRYKIENIGDQPLTLDFADYFSIGNNSTIWGCTESIGADVLTTCGADNVNPQFNSGTSVTYNGGVYLRDAHIEVPGDFLIITVTRNPIITVDNTTVDILASALVTSAVDAYGMNNSDTRTFIGNTNMAPTISTVADQTILEDSAGTGSLNFTVADIETPAANLVVTATSSNQSIVTDANITITNGATANDRKVTVVTNANANTATGPVTITLTVTDSSAGTNTSTFLLNVTPVNDKPTFTTQTIADFAAGTSGTQVVPSFLQNISFGPTSDESSQTIMAKNIFNVSDPNGVLTGSISLFTDLVLPLSGQGGTVSFDVTIQDDGLTANGGLDTSDPVTVTFTVLNTLPIISTVSNTSIFEDNTTAAIALTVSDAETAAASLTLSAMSSDTSIVPVSGIQFGGSGGSRTVQITPTANQNTAVSGVVTITLIVNDGTDTAQSTFDLTINPVNDAPTFSLGANINNVVADAGSLIPVLNYATALSMGPTGDEDLNQNISNYNIQVTDTSSIFDQSIVPVDINNNGTLNYVLTGNTGTATIQVSLQDDGLTANGGVDTSATQTFTITVQ